MARPKGGEKLGGRAKGTPNKLTQSVKSVFANVFDKLQEDEDREYSLANWAKENPTDFYKLSTKLIPTAIEGKVEGITINVKPPKLE